MDLISVSARRFPSATGKFPGNVVFVLFGISMMTLLGWQRELIIQGSVFMVLTHAPLFETCVAHGPLAQARRENPIVFEEKAPLFS